VTDGEANSPILIYRTSNLCKINNFHINFPFLGVAQDDGKLMIFDLTRIDGYKNQIMDPIFQMERPGEACMDVVILKDTFRIYSIYEESGIFGYNFPEEQFSIEKTEWH